MDCGILDLPPGKFGVNKKLKELKKFWKNKKIFLTGHTGFKGSWFVIFLNLLGAKITGYSLSPPKKLNFFQLANLNKICEKSIIGDIRDYKKLKKSIINASPDIIVHMAAQPLVRDSYDFPKYTYEVNTLGTINILNIINEINTVKAALIITTDKVYTNSNKIFFFKESDSLGGSDPYSSSKSLAELSIYSYIKSFFKRKKIFVASARAGNVIGGGDFSKNRVIADYFRSLKKKKIYLRQPNSIRPWQHVIDPLYGYLLLLKNLYQKKKYEEHSWNFGPKPSNNKTVREVVEQLNIYFNNSIKIFHSPRLVKNYHESKVLMLNSNKAKKNLKWFPKYNLNKSLKLVAEWYKVFYKKGDLLNMTQNQIIDYLKK